MSFPWWGWRRKIPRGRAALRWLLAAGALVALGACASYTTRMSDLRQAASGGRLDEALREIDEHARPGELLYHLERGTLLHQAQDYQASNQEFDRAERLVEELYTISLSRRGLTFLLNDEVEPYAGETFEASYLHYYRILNFLALGDDAEAAVEARRLSQRLATLRESGMPPAADDPFLEYLAGTIAESQGEWNDALVSYRLALGAWARVAQQGGEQPPPWLSQDLRRAARALGVSLESLGDSTLMAYAGAPPATEAEPTARGDLLVLFEVGWVPHKVSRHLRVPIFESDPDWEGEDGASRAGPVLAERWRGYSRSGVWSSEPVRVKYFLDVAVPELVRDTQSAVTACRIILDAGGKTAVQSSPDAVPAVLVADLARRVEETFQAAEIGMLAKTLARALIKYGLHQQTRKRGGELLGLLTNLVGVATEKADTRSWLTLPAYICAARIHLPLGEHTLRMELLDETGGVCASTARDVVLEPDRVSVLAWRSLR